MKLSKLWALAMLPALAGCATVQMMRDLPPEAGDVARYDAPSETLVAAAEEAVRQQHLGIADSARLPDSAVLIALRSGGPFSNGHFVRVRITPDSGGLTTVRIISRSGSLLDWAHPDAGPRLLNQIDARLDASALGPWPGMRIRATPSGSSAITGTVVRVAADTLFLQGSGDSPGLRIPALDELLVSRGSYRHTRDGALIGSLLGLLLGAAIGSGQKNDSYAGGPYAGLETASGALLGMTAGALVGAAVGASVQTEVWSPVRIR